MSTFTIKSIGPNLAISTDGATTVPLYTYSVKTKVAASSTIPQPVVRYLQQQINLFLKKTELAAGIFEGLTLCRAITSGVTASIVLDFDSVTEVVSIGVEFDKAGTAIVNFPASLENGFQAIPAGASGGGGGGGGVQNVNAVAGSGIVVNNSDSKNPLIGTGVIPIAHGGTGVGDPGGVDTNYVFAGAPDVGFFPPSFRALVLQDIPKPLQAIYNVQDGPNNFILNFSLGNAGGITINGDATFTTANVPSNASITMRVKVSIGGGGPFGLTFPAWFWATPKPADTGAGGTALLTLTNFGSTDGDIVASWQALGF